jgi:hypothetical protein
MSYPMYWRLVGEPCIAVYLDDLSSYIGILFHLLCEFY